MFIQRLKDKLGNRSNASAEVELDRAWARIVGEEGRGVPVIAEMVNMTRLDCILGTAALEAVKDKPRTDEAQARRLAERLARLLQASLLVRHSPPAIADAFCATRLGGEGGLAYGALPTGADVPAILSRAWPASD
jgi:putative acyl-CoA dehydrogenase